jgi:hypothetical protein
MLTLRRVKVYDSCNRSAKTGLQSLARAEHPPVVAETIQRRRIRAGFFKRMFDAHVDRFTSTTNREPVFLSWRGRIAKRPQRIGIGFRLALWKLAAKVRSGSASERLPRPLRPAFSGIHRELPVFLP